MKKRVFAVILGSVMAVSLMACGTKDEGQRTVQKHIQLGFRSLQNMVLWITAGKDLSKDSKKPDLKKERTGNQRRECSC